MEKGKKEMTLKSLLNISGLDNREKFVIDKKLKDIAKEKKSVDDWVSILLDRKIFDKIPKSLDKLKSN